MLTKAMRLNNLPPDFTTLEKLFNSADFALFRNVLANPEHVLHLLLGLPSRKLTVYQLRNLSHALIVPQISLPLTQ